jgi:hypothetical protein
MWLKTPTFDIYPTVFKQAKTSHFTHCVLTNESKSFFHCGQARKRVICPLCSKHTNLRHFAHCVGLLSKPSYLSKDVRKTTWQLEWVSVQNIKTILASSCSMLSTLPYVCRELVSINGGILHNPTDISENCVIWNLKVSYNKNRIDPIRENWIVSYDTICRIV